MNRFIKCNKCNQVKNCRLKKYKGIFYIFTKKKTEKYLCKNCSKQIKNE